jgi:hypothetical protein
MKWLKAPEPQKKTTRKPSRPAPVKSYKPKKQKRRKPMWKRGLEEAWDIIEDIFD